MVTDKIVRFTKTGILLESGQELPADIIVTATGLKLLPLGGIQISVDGEVQDPHHAVVYKSFMLSGIPNFAFAFGYTNSSWTLKVDLVCEHLCRLIALHGPARLHRRHAGVRRPGIQTKPMLDFSAGYIPVRSSCSPAGHQRTLDGGDERSRRPGAAAQRARWTMPPSGSLPRRARWPPPEPPRGECAAHPAISGRGLPL